MAIREQLSVPSKIDIVAILNSAGYPDQYINDHQDKYNYVLHKITETKVFNRALGNDGFANLSMFWLRTFLGRRYADEIVKNLLRWGIIQCDGHYIVANKEKGIKGKPLGYRIHPDYQSKSILRMVFKDEVFGKKLRALQAKNAKENARKTEWKNLTKLRIRHDAALSYIEAKWTASMQVLDIYAETLHGITTSADVDTYRYESILSSWKSYSLLLPTPCYLLMMVQAVKKSLHLKRNQGLTAYDLVYTSLLEQYEAEKMSIGKIYTRQFFMEQPDPLSRVYTNLSNLATDLRQFIYHSDDEPTPLVNLDIRNSQPYLLSLLLMDQCKGKPLPADVQEYIRLTSSGTFYDVLMDEMKVPASQRKAWKVVFFASVFFCRNGYSKRTPEGQLFQRRFPNVYKLVETAKKNDHANLAIMMQRREAGVILTKIGGQLAKESIWYSTIHDSVLVRPEHRQRATEIILAAFMDEVGVTPTLEAEELTTSLKAPVLTLGIHDIAEALMFVEPTDETETKLVTLELDFDADEYPVLRRSA